LKQCCGSMKFWGGSGSGSSYFFLLGDGRIQEAQKHVDPSDSDPDPQHCFEGLSEIGGQVDFSKNLPRLSL
jgi:hypothetical protein